MRVQYLSRNYIRALATWSQSVDFQSCHSGQHSAAPAHERTCSQTRWNESWHDQQTDPDQTCKKEVAKKGKQACPMF